MGRYVNPVPQTLNGNGSPIVGAKLYFYEPGTTTLKTIYSDSGLTTPATNPAIADSTGRYSNIFLDGIYRTIQTDENDVQIWDRDPVGDVIEGEWQDWISGTIYNIPQIVRGSDDEYYRSLTDSNQGNDPTTSAASWEKLQLGRVWNTNVTYSATDSAYGSDGMLYFSRAASNQGNDPTSTPLSWIRSDFKVGQFVFIGSSSDDIGALKCDGGAYSRTTYSALFAEIGTTYGVGDGSTTFNVPNFDGRKPIGFSGSRPIGTPGGAATHAQTLAELRNHDHQVAAWPVAGGATTARIEQTVNNGSETLAQNTTAAGTSTPMPIEDPYLPINIGIKF